MKKIAIFLGLVAWIFMTGIALADCWGKTEVVSIEESGLKEITEYQCWPNTKIRLSQIGDYVVFKGTIRVGSLMNIEERENVVYIFPAKAEKNLILTLNGRRPEKVEFVWENRKNIFSEIKSDYAKLYFSVKKEDLPIYQAIEFILIIRPRKANIEFAFRPEILSKK